MEYQVLDLGLAMCKTSAPHYTIRHTIPAALHDGVP